MKKLYLQLFLLCSFAATGNDTIVQQHLSFNPTQQSSSPPAHIKPAERVHSALHNHNKKHIQQSNSPTQSQLNTVLSWMSQLYTGAPSCAATQPIPSPQPTTLAPKKLQQRYDSYERIVEQRTNAREQRNKNNCGKTLQRYTLSSMVNDFCATHDINNTSLKTCNGDTLQHVIHGEFIAITEQSALVWKNSHNSHALQKLPAILADFTDAGVRFNHQGEIDKAITLADACWMLLDCVQAVGEGVFQGVCATVDDIIHPIRTVRNIVESTALCGCYIGKIALEVCELEYLFHTNQITEAFEKQSAWAHNVITVYEALHEHCATLTARDAIKETVAFGTQCYATNKALRGIGTLFKQAHKHAIKIIEEAAHTAPALTTPEGIVFRIADSTAECMKNAQPLAFHKFPTVNNMKEFFELPFGKICFEHSQKTKRLFQKFSSVYEITQDIPGTTLKEGYTYYLDRFHGDHIEVFNKKLKVAGVYNLDGTFNALKFEAAKKSGRNIKNLMR